MTTVTLDNKQGHHSDDPQMTINFGPSIQRRMACCA